eukprot:tig00021760_g23433.t1
MFPLAVEESAMYASPGAVKKSILRLDLVPALDQMEADLKAKAGAEAMGLVISEQPGTRVGSLAPTPRELSEAGEEYEAAKLALLNKRFAPLGVIVERSPARPLERGSPESVRTAAASSRRSSLRSVGGLSVDSALRPSKEPAIGFRRTALDDAAPEGEYEGQREVHQLVSRITAIEGAVRAAAEAEAAAASARCAAEKDRRAARAAAERVVAAHAKLRALEAERELYRRRAGRAAEEAAAAARTAGEAEKALEAAGREREDAAAAAAAAEREARPLPPPRPSLSRAWAEAGARGAERVAEAAVGRVKAVAALLARARAERAGAERAARAEEQRAGEAGRRAASLAAELQRQRAAWADDVRALARAALQPGPRAACSFEDDLEAPAA